MYSCVRISPVHISPAHNITIPGSRYSSAIGCTVPQPECIRRSSHARTIVVRFRPIRDRVRRPQPVPYYPTTPKGPARGRLARRGDQESPLVHSSGRSETSPGLQSKNAAQVAQNPIPTCGLGWFGSLHRAPAQARLRSQECCARPGSIEPCASSEGPTRTEPTARKRNRETEVPVQREDLCCVAAGPLRGGET